MVFPQMNWQEPRELLNQSPLNKKKTSVMLQLYLKEEKSHIHVQKHIQDSLFDSSLTMHCAIVPLTSITLLNCSHITKCSMGTWSWIKMLWFNFILGLPFISLCFGEW